jgi:hypothetical protein
MSIRNNQWYNLNEQRDYPLDDTASALSDNGERLPAALISDLRLRWPDTYGRYAFVSSAAVTPYIVTFMIEATNDLDNSPSSSVLIAGISIPLSEFIQGRTYPLTTFKPGVGGFVTIGSGVDVLFKGLFSSPRQTLLTARAARASRVPPVPTLGIEQAASALKGVVNLVARSPIELVKEPRVIDGVEYENVIVFRLVEEASDIAVDTFAASVYSRYAGPCGRRAGSKSCVDPQPIQTINGVAPDCDGVLVLEFEGCATVGRNTEDCGVIIDCNLGLSASCDPPYLPELSTGKLPSEVPPAIIPPPIPPEPPVGPEVSISENIVSLLSLPYCDTFDDGIAYNFSPTGNSLFGIIADDSPGERACCDGPPPTSDAHGCDTSQSISISENAWLVESILDVSASYGAVAPAAQARTNISLFTADVQTLFRKYTTDAQITQGQLGSSLNAGILVNYQGTTSGLGTYFLVRLDVAGSTFGVYYFNGVQLVPLSEVEVIDARTGDWYRMAFTLVPDTVTQTSVSLVAELDGITDPTVAVTINTSISSNLWGSDSGLAGLYANRSRSYFSFWRIDEAI